MTVYVGIRCPCLFEYVAAITGDYQIIACPECQKEIYIRQAEKPSRIFKPGMSLKEKHDVVCKIIKG